MIERDGDRVRLGGPITMANAATLETAGRRLFADGPLAFDLAGVTEVDSSALSLLLEWGRAAQGAGRNVAFCNLPENLKSLAALYGVLELLPLDGRS